MSEEQPTYVAGFLFSEDKKQVLLIEKTHPAWQAGKLNGIGGKCEPGDGGTFNSMRREFHEEAGLDISDWHNFAILHDARGWSVWFYFAFGDIWKAEKRTEENLLIIDVSLIQSSERVIPNLKWLIPLALSIVNERVGRFDIDEVDLSKEAQDRRAAEWVESMDATANMKDGELIDAVNRAIGDTLPINELPFNLLSELADRFMEAKGLYQTPNGIYLHGEFPPLHEVKSK